MVETYHFIFSKDLGTLLKVLMFAVEELNKRIIGKVMFQIYPVHGV